MTVADEKLAENHLFNFYSTYYSNIYIFILLIGIYIQFFVS